MLVLSVITKAEPNCILPAVIEISFAAKAAATCPPASKFETLLSPILDTVTLEFNKVDILVNPVPPALAASVPDSSLRAVGIVVLVGCAPPCWCYI